MTLRTRIEAEIGPLTDWVAFRDLLIDVLVEVGYEDVSARIRSVYGPTMHDDPRAIVDLIVQVADVTDTAARDALYSVAHLSNAGAADIYRRLLTVVDTQLEGVGAPRLLLARETLLESASIGDLVGTLSVTGLPDGVTVTGYTITADPDSKFVLDGVDNTRLELEATLNYEAATSHSVTIEAALSAGDPLTRTFSIAVGNVLEVTLAELSLDDVAAVAGEAWSATITGKTSGSTITATSSDGTTLTVDGTTVAGTFAVAGSPDITLRETHPDAAPRETEIAVTVSPAEEPGEWDLTPGAGTMTIAGMPTVTVPVWTPGAGQITLTGGI